jgi:L-arabinose isomerase
MLKRAEINIGLITPGFAAYWPQMPGILEEIKGYNQEIATELGRYGTVVNVGVVDDQERARLAAQQLRERCIDVLFIHVATYAPSQTLLRAVHDLAVPLISLHLQPVDHFRGKNDSSVTLPKNTFSAGGEMSNVLLRAGRRFHSVIGRLHGEARVWSEIAAWCTAVRIRKALSYSNVALVGQFFPGMCDLHIDACQMMATFGVNLVWHEPAVLRTCVEAVSEADIAASYARTADTFSFVGPINADKIRWCNQVAAGLARYAAQYQLDGLAFHFSGYPDSIEERIGYSLTLGGSFLTADGIPCLAEGDILLTIPMLILGALAGGAAQSEINVCDYDADCSYVGHAGPGNFRLAAEQPILRWLDYFHGKKGNGVSCEFSFKPGPVTLLSLVQHGSHYRFVVTEAEAIPGERLKNGNVNTCVRFNSPVASFFAQWLAQGPTHHSAMSPGHHADAIRKTATLLGLETIEI